MKQLILIFILLWASIGHSAETLYPAAFKTEKYRLSTLEQFETRVREKYPELSIIFNRSAKAIYKEKSYDAIEVKVDGILSDTKIEQKFTYINLYEGLWKLLFIEGKECIKGQVMKDGESVTQWGCKELFFPFSGAFADLFFIDNLEVDIAKLSVVWGQEVSVNDDTVDNSEEEKVLTLGDLKKIILDGKGQWEIEKTVWAGTSHNPKPEKQALLIKVKGPFDSLSTYDQSFLYAIDEGLLNLKEIDGKLCKFNKTHGKEFCEELYVPTSVTPFPMVLINSEELSGSTGNKEPEIVEEQKPELPCGNLQASYNAALRVYFQTSIFYAKDLEGYRKALSILPQAADPQGIFVSQALVDKMASINKDPYPLSQVVEELKLEIAKGTQGRCDVLIPWAQEVKDEISEKGKDVKALVHLIQENNFDLNLIEKNLSTLSKFSQKLWSTVKMSGPPVLAQVNPSASLDVATGHLLRYYNSALNRASDAEELYTAALFKQDYFSRLLDESEVVDVGQSIHGHGSSKLFFGVRVSTGSKNHYIYGLHKDTQEKYNLKPGDQLLKINGVDANVGQMSAKAVDDVLADTSKAIKLSVAREGSVHEVEIVARDIDLMEYFYSLEVLDGENGSKALKVRINSFEAGMAQSLYAAITNVLKSENISGIILDLQSNPGGSTDEAASVISFFTKDRVPYYYRKGSRFLTTADIYPGTPELFISETLPLVVQTNSYTASSSEIVTSSLKDMNRAIVVGANTFGKLVGQHYESVPLSSKKVLAMLVTSTEFFTPTGRSLNGKGVKPHINVYSQQGGTFKDGNLPGVDFEVLEENIVQPYQSILSPAELQQIQDSVVVDESDIDSVSLEVIQMAQP